MTGIRILAWVVVVAMTSAILYGFVNGDFGGNASAIWGLPWGKVTLIDLYAGLVIFGAWVAVREASRVTTALWWIALTTLGNLAAGVYLLRALFDAEDTNELLMGRDRTGRATISTPRSRPVARVSRDPKPRSGP